MTRLILLSLILWAPMTLMACEPKESSNFIILLSDLAKSEGLELVYGNKFPEINPYGSYGSPYVVDFANFGNIKSSILFLARKKNKFYKNKDQESSLDLVRHYDYYLVFAVKREGDDKFKVINTLSNGVGLMGMSLYYGKLNIDMSNFSYIGNGLKINSASVDFRKISIPVVISAESSTKILYYYDGKWMQYVERVE